MTAPQFLASLEARGVELILDPDAPSGVSAIAPDGVITPAVAAKIRAALPALRPLIVDVPIASNASQAGQFATAPNPAPVVRSGQRDVESALNGGTSDSSGGADRSTSRTATETGISGKCPDFTDSRRVWTLDDDLTTHPCYVKRPSRFTGGSRWDGGTGEAAGEWLMSLTDAQRAILFLVETRDVLKPLDWSEADEANAQTVRFHRDDPKTRKSCPRTPRLERLVPGARRERSRRGSAEGCPDLARRRGRLRHALGPRGRRARVRSD